MCGIAGFVTTNNELGYDGLEALGQKMADALSHRGPDDWGVWSDSDRGVCLAHRRLSIQDLSPMGHQPMISSTGRFVLAYNGEIYNFLELREALVKRGHSFRGHSDTEVLLALIEANGLEKTLEMVTGMFAIAVFDRRSGELSLARDRMGEKPLYFGWLGPDFVFTSELRALRCLPAWGPPALNTDALHLFFRHGYVPTPHSVYSGLHKLYPGSWLTLGPRELAHPAGFNPLPGSTKGDGFSPSCFWSLEKARSAGGGSRILDPGEAAEEVDRLLHNVVRNQLISDVPVGMFLSGGIDSSLVTAVAQAVSATPVRTFTIGFHEKDFNEAEFAGEIARYLGTEHHELYLSADEARDTIGKLPDIYDEPFADPSQIPTFLISGLARQEVTVALSGDGGDELFAGYNRYLYPGKVMTAREKLPGFLRRTLAGSLLRMRPSSIDRMYSLASRLPVPRLRGQTRVGLKLHKLAGALESTSEFDLYEDLISYWPDHTVPLLQRADSSTLWPGRFSTLFSGDFLESAMLYDQQVYLPDNNLVKVDRASMNVSLETRLPLLDHEMVELSWRIPPEVKMHDGVLKWVLRRTLAKHLPESLFERPKMGFSVPVADWLRGPLREWARDLLSPASLRETAVLDPVAVSACLADHLSGRRDYALRLWSALMFQAWSRQANG